MAAYYKHLDTGILCSNTYPPGLWSQSYYKPPTRQELATHSSTLAWESHGQTTLAGCSPWGCKESDTTEATSLSFFSFFLSSFCPATIHLCMNGKVLYL